MCACHFVCAWVFQCEQNNCLTFCFRLVILGMFCLWFVQLFGCSVWITKNVFSVNFWLLVFLFVCDFNESWRKKKGACVYIELVFDVWMFCFLMFLCGLVAYVVILHWCFSVFLATYSKFQLNFCWHKYDHW